MGSLLKLIIEDDEGKTTIYPLAEDDVSIGRREGNTIRLMERNVSRRHARLVRDHRGAVLVEDLDSYNGVRINGERILGRHAIQVGDLVEIGDYHLTVHQSEIPDPQPEPPPAPTQPPMHVETHGGGLEPTRPMPAPRSGPAPVAEEPYAGELPRDTLIDQPIESPTAPPTAATVPLLPPLSTPTDGVDAPGASGLLPRVTEQARVVCVSTEYAGQAFTLGPETVIGRVEDNDVVIEHRSVSRSHAKLVATNHGHRIVDLQSANGILVNGEEYAMTELRAGDLIELGHVQFRYVPAGAPFQPTDEESRAMNEQGVQVEEPLYDPSTAATVTDSPLVSAERAPSATVQNASPQASAPTAVRPMTRAPTLPTDAAAAVPPIRPAPAAFPPAESAWTQPPPVSRPSSKLPWVVAGLGLLAGLVAVGVAVLVPSSPPDEPVAEPQMEFEGANPDAQLRFLYDAGRYEELLRFYQQQQGRFVDRAQAGLWVGKAQERLAEQLAREGVRAYQQEDYRAAIQFLERCLERAPNMSTCHRNLAIAFTQLDEYSKAAMHYERFMELEPNHQDAPRIRKILRDYKSGAAELPSAPDGTAP